MWVLMVQSEVGYATQVSVKPAPIWSSSRKDWSDWSMVPAWEEEEREGTGGGAARQRCGRGRARRPGGARRGVVCGKSSRKTR